MQTTRSGFSKPVTLFKRATLIKIRDSMKVGSAKTFSFLVSLNFSNKKAEVNEPNKNEKIYKKLYGAFPEFEMGHIVNKKGKVPCYVCCKLFKR